MKKIVLRIVVIVLVAIGVTIYSQREKSIDKNDKIDTVVNTIDAGTGKTSLGTSSSGE